MTNKMIKVKSTVYPTPEAVDMLYNKLVPVASTTYPDQASMDAAMVAAKADFEIALGALLHKAFKAGKKLGKTYCEKPTITQ